MLFAGAQVKDVVDSSLLGNSLDRKEDSNVDGVLSSHATHQRLHLASGSQRRCPYLLCDMAQPLWDLLQYGCRRCAWASPKSAYGTVTAVEVAALD